VKACILGLLLILMSGCACLDHSKDIQRIYDDHGYYQGRIENGRIYDRRGYYKGRIE